VFSQIVAEVTVENYETYLLPLINQIVSERNRIFAELGRIEGLTPVASKANFMIVKTAIDPKRIFADLLARDVLIRDVSGYPMLKDYFRFSVGTPEQNDYLLNSLREICG